MQNSVDLTQRNKSEDVRYRDVNEMSMAELSHPETSALNARDAGKFLVEAARRLSAPLTAVSFALVALLSVLTGAFQRHGNVLRPLAAVMGVVVAARGAAGGGQPGRAVHRADAAGLGGRGGTGPRLRLGAVRPPPRAVPALLRLAARPA